MDDAAAIEKFGTASKREFQTNKRTAMVRRPTITYIASIHAAYPDLRIERMRLNDEGQYNDILIVNDDLIFRFPRHDEGIEKLAKEIALLDRIRPLVTLAVPEPIYRRLTPRAVGQVFAGYRMLPGEPLWRETVRDDHRSSDRGATCDATGNLSARTARHPHQSRRRCAARPAIGANSGPISKKRYAPRSFRICPPPHRSRLRHGSRPSSMIQSNFAFTPTMIHGDFGTGNLLWDAHAGTMTAVIDFGSAGIGDPALDVAALLTYGEPFVRQGFAAYPAMEAILPRARFYLSTFLLQEALYGVEHNEPDAIERGLAPYLR